MNIPEAVTEAPQTPPQAASKKNGLFDVKWRIIVVAICFTVLFAAMICIFCLVRPPFSPTSSISSQRLSISVPYCHIRSVLLDGTTCKFRNCCTSHARVITLAAVEDWCSAFFPHILILQFASLKMVPFRLMKQLQRCSHRCSIVRRPQTYEYCDYHHCALFTHGGIAQRQCGPRNVDFCVLANTQLGLVFFP